MDLTVTQKPGAMANIVKTLAHLLDRGWIPLGRLGCLLDITPESARNRKPTNLPTMLRVGGVTRVYHDDLLAFLKNHPRRHPKTEHVDAVLALYKTMRAQRAPEHQEDQLSFSDTIYNQQKYQAILDDPGLTEEEREWLRGQYFD